MPESRSCPEPANLGLLAKQGEKCHLEGEHAPEPVHRPRCRALVLQSLINLFWWRSPCAQRWVLQGWMWKANSCLAPKEPRSGIAFSLFARQGVPMQEPGHLGILRTLGLFCLFWPMNPFVFGKTKAQGDCCGQVRRGKS